MEEMHAIGRKGRRGGSSITLRVRLFLDRLASGMSVSWRQLFVLITILLAGIIASLIVFVAVKGWEDERITSEVDHRLNRVATTLTRHLDVDLAILESVAALQAASGNMSYSEFQAMVSPAWSEHDAIQALAWVPRVPSEERSDFQWRAHTGGFHGFSIHEQRREDDALPTVQRQEAFPIYYLEPMRGNESLLGFDLNSGHPYQAAMKLARDTGEAAATRLIEFEYADGPRRVIVVVTPVYKGKSVPSELEQRRLRLSGFVAGVFLVDDILTASMAGLENALSLAVTDESEATPDGYRVIYEHDNEVDLFANVVFAGDPIRRLAVATTVELGGRSWVLRAAPKPSFLVARRGWQAESLLVAGLQFSALLVAYLWQVFGRTAQVERLVDERTSDLTRSNHELKREIIQRRAAERALTQGEERIRSIIHTVEVPLDLGTVETKRELDGAAEALRGRREEFEHVADTEYDEEFDLDDLDYDDQEALPLAGSSASSRDSVLTVVRDGDTDVDASEAAIGVMSRDMRSPVSSMIYAAKILAKHRGLSTDKVAKFAGIVVDEGERLTSLINQALQVSNMDAVRGDALTTTNVEVSELMSKITSVVETYAARKRVTLELHADPYLEPVAADENRIAQVLMTLIENGIRSTPARERVRVSVDQHNQNYVRFSVADSSAGLSVPDQESAFDAFSADTEVLKTQARDLGVGLAICREIVERHGGTIWVESRPGAGSVFSFTLPVVNKRQARMAERV